MCSVNIAVFTNLSHGVKVYYVLHNTFFEIFHLENFTIYQIFFRQCVHGMNSLNFSAAKVSLHMVAQNIQFYFVYVKRKYISAVILSINKMNFNILEWFTPLYVRTTHDLAKILKKPIEDPANPTGHFSESQ